MGKLQRLKMFTTHIQYLGLLKKINLPYPKEFVAMMSVADIFNLDINLAFDFVEIPRIKQRSVFILVAIGIPLLLMIITSLVFFKISKIIQISSLLFGLAIMAVFFVQLFGAGEQIPPQYRHDVSQVEFAVLGGSFVLFPALFKFSKMMQWRFNGNLDALQSLLPLGSVLGGSIAAGLPWLAQQILVGYMAIYLCHCAWTGARRRARFLGIAIVVGGAIYVIGWMPPIIIHVPEPISVPGFIVTGVGVFGTIEQFFMSGYGNKSRALQRARDKFNTVLDTGLLSLAMFGLASAFVPVITFCLDMYLCAVYSCPVNSKFNPHASRPEESYSTGSELFCDACVFNSSSCAFDTKTLCPAFESNRLLKYPSVSCEDEGFLLFEIAAGIILFVFCVIVMILYTKLIRCCTSSLMIDLECKRDTEAEWRKPLLDKVPKVASVASSDTFGSGSGSDSSSDSGSEPPTPPGEMLPEGEEEQWAFIMDKSEPKAASLYQAFHYKFRYFIMMDTLHKLAIVISNVVVAPYSKLATLPNFIAHIVMLGVLMVFSPYVDPLEQRLSLILAACSCLNGFYAILIWHAPTDFATTGWAIAVVLINVLIPGVAGLIMTVIEVRDALGKKKDELTPDELKAKQLKERVAERRAMLILKINNGGSDDDDDNDSDLWTDDDDGDALTLDVGSLDGDTFMNIELGSISDMSSIDSDFLDEDELLLRKNKVQAREIKNLEKMERIAKEAEDAVKEQKGEGGDDDKDGKKKKKKKKKIELTAEEQSAKDIDDETKDIILKYFAYFGVPCLLIALGITLFATANAAEDQFVDASAMLDRRKSNVLNGYDTWPEFSSRCCCMESEQPIVGYNVSERWVCVGQRDVPLSYERHNSSITITAGPTIDRGRITKDVSNDGLAIRGVCEKRLAPQCNMTLQADNETVVMECDPAFIATNNITKRAVLSLW
jgi:hypothetical protein